MKDLLEVQPILLIDKIKNICFGFVIMLIWAFLIKFGFSLLNGGNPTLQGGGGLGGITVLQFIFYACVRAPLWEELVFRFAPITFARMLNPLLLWPVIIMSSTIFGMGHTESMDRILIQGAMGVVFSIVYIKNGYSYWSSVTLHFMWNSFLGIAYGYGG